MNSDTERILRLSGWSAERRYDFEGAERTLLADGYEVPPVVRAFVQSFGGLLVRFERPDTHEIGELDLNPEFATQSVYRERVQEYERRVGRNLVPVGVAYSKHMVLMLDDRGRLWGAYDDLLLLLGDSPGSAFQNIFFGTPAKTNG